MAHPDITIAGATFSTVPSVLIPRSDSGDAEFFDMSEDMSWMGGDVVKIQDIAETSTKLSDTLYASWTPSTTAKDIIATSDAGTFVADMANYEYFLVWDCLVPIISASGATKKALPLLTAGYMVQQLCRRPASWATIRSSTFSTNTSVNCYTNNFLRYYGTTTGTVTYTWGASYGIYFTPTAATFSNSTADNPTVTIKRPKVSARCSTTYMSTTSAGKITQADTIITISGHVYRTRTKGVMRGISENVVRLINSQDIVT